MPQSKTSYLAYIAGFFDGEGCVSLPRTSGRTNERIEVQINNTDHRPLDLIAKIYGGSVYLVKSTRSNRKDIYKWNAVNARAKRFLEEILPYLITKRRQTELALHYMALPRKNNAANIARMPQRSKLEAYSFNALLSGQRERIRTQLHELKVLVL